jgi:hypothetical protein
MLVLDLLAILGTQVKAEIYPPRPSGTPVLTFFYSGGTPE